MIRLQKFIAECGIASRRKAEDLIRAGKVKVNGQVIVELGTKIDPGKDKICVNGKIIEQKEPKVYLKLNKPRGYVSSCARQKGEKTILDLVKSLPFRLYPIGRLDKDSEGLTLLTNDGELANKLMHPRYEHEKEYEVNVQLTINNEQLRKLGSGIYIEGKRTLPAKIYREGEKSFRIILKEGRKRQIRKMVEMVGDRVLGLKRIRMKNIQLGDLAPGKFAYLTPSEIRSLML